MRMSVASYLPLLLTLLFVTGCALPERWVPLEEGPEHRVPTYIWEQVDQAIFKASVSATARAVDAARSAMNAWEERTWRRIETDFIPWYVDYWTQEWLFMHMIWYQMQAQESAPERMKSYLLAQFSQRVLQPVSQVTDPARIAATAAQVYLDELRASVARIQDGNRIPTRAWRRRMDRFALIELPGSPPERASLGELLQPGDMRAPGAYSRLIAYARSAEAEISTTPPGSELDRLIDRLGSGLEERAALKGGVAAAATIAGGGLGLLISAGAALFGFQDHEAIKPDLEVEVRNALKSLLQRTSDKLMHDRRHGVLSPIQHMHAHLEEHIWNDLLHPLPDSPGDAPADPSDYVSPF